MTKPKTFIPDHVATPYRAPRPELPIATAQLSRGLLRLYGRLKGELRKSKTGEDPLIDASASREYMRCIERLMPLLGVDFDPEAIRTVRTRVQIGPLDWGDLRTGVLQVLKARQDWMTYREVADSLLARSRADLDVPTKSKFVQKVREAMFFQTKAGAVEREKDIPVGGHEQLQRFRLSQTMFRP